MNSETLIFIFSFLLGLAFGSFITAASYRIPRKKDFIFARSFCPKCHSKLSFLDLFPLFSWLIARGKCRHCHTAISIRYPLTELATGLLFTFIIYLHGISLFSLLLLILTVVLLILIIIDLEHYIIPDSLQLTLLVGLPFYLYFIPYYDFVAAFISGGSAFFVIITLRFLVGYWKKQEALGLGDVKLITIIGAYVGLMALPGFFLIAGIIGMLFGLVFRITQKEALFPFGPALACSFWLYLAIPDWNNHLYNTISDVLSSILISL